MQLLPFNRSRRLARQFVHDAVHVGNLGGDALIYKLQEGPGEFDGAGDHEVVGFDGAEGDGVIVGTDTVFDADGLEAGHDGKELGGEIGEPMLDDGLAENGVGFAENVEFLARDAAETADGETGAGERLPLDERCGQPERSTDGADFFLEEHAQRLDNALKQQVFGEAADVMVTLYDLTAVAAFDDIGINRPLREIRFAAEPGRLFLKDADKLLADDLAFFLRIEHAFDAVNETVGGVDGDQRNPERLREHLADHARFVFTHEPVIYKNTGELVADGLVYQRRNDGGIDAAGQRADDALIADLPPHLIRRLFQKRLDGPVSGAAAHIKKERPEMVVYGERLQNHGLLARFFQRNELHAEKIPVLPGAARFHHLRGGRPDRKDGKICAEHALPEAGRDALGDLAGAGRRIDPAGHHDALQRFARQAARLHRTSRRQDLAVNVKVADFVDDDAGEPAAQINY